MKRDYANETSNSAAFFTGIEVEHTPTLGMKTLFVVGIHPPRQIAEMAFGLHCKAVYFGANQSFEADNTIEMEEWTKMIVAVLDHPANLKCTLDFDVSCVDLITDDPVLINYTNFIPMISVKVPRIAELGYNATVKIDDIDFESTNPGVWCHMLSDLMARNKFTDWSKYKDDKTV